MLTIEACVPYVGYVVDDAGAGRSLGADIHAIVRLPGMPFRYPSRIVGFQCGFKPMCVSVHSYLDVQVTDEEAEAMAIEYLEERNWFSDSSAAHSADFIL